MELYVSPREFAHMPVYLVLRQHRSAFSFLINEVLATNLQFYFETLYRNLTQEEQSLPHKSCIQLNFSEINLVLKPCYLLFFSGRNYSSKDRHKSILFQGSIFPSQTNCLLATINFKKNREGQTVSDNSKQTKMTDRKDSTMYHQEYIPKRFPNPSFMTEKNGNTQPNKLCL